MTQASSKLFCWFHSGLCRILNANPENHVREAWHCGSKQQ